MIDVFRKNIRLRESANKIKEKAKQIYPPGFQNTDLWSVWMTFYESWDTDKILTKAAALAFYFFMSVFPAIIFIFALIPYIPIDGFQEHLLTLMQTALPENAYAASEETLLLILMQQNGELLSIVGLVSLWFANSAVTSLIRTFYVDGLHYQHKRSFIQRRLIALALNFYLIIALIFGICLFVYAEFSLSSLEDLLILSKKDHREVSIIFQWSIILFITYLSIAIIFYYGQEYSKLKIFFSPGALLSTILIVVVTKFLAYYIDHFSLYNKIYGSIGALVAIMLLFEINSLFVIIGFELNASIQKVADKLIKEKNIK